MKNTDRQVVWICGAAHSGSTLAGYYLGASPEPFKYFHVGECHAFFRSKHKNYGNPKFASDFWDKIDPTISHAKTYGEIFSGSDATVLIDSSKLLQWFGPMRQFLRRTQIPVHIVVALRPFVRIVRSSLVRKPEGLHAINALNYYRKLLADIRILSPDSISVVTPQTFLGDYPDKLKTLCKTTNIPYYDDKKSYWNYQHHCLYGATLQRQQATGQLNPGIVARKDDAITDFSRELNIIDENGFSDLESGYVEKLFKAAVTKEVFDLRA